MDPDRRSIALHEAVAQRLLEEPRWVDIARARVQDWLDTGGGAHPRYARRWLELLDKPVEELATYLTASDSEAATLRSVSPFAGVLSPRERWAILRELRP